MLFVLGVLLQVVVFCGGVAVAVEVGEQVGDGDHVHLPAVPEHHETEILSLPVAQGGIDVLEGGVQFFEGGCFGRVPGTVCLGPSFHEGGDEVVPDELATIGDQGGDLPVDTSFILGSVESVAAQESLEDGQDADQFCLAFHVEQDVGVTVVLDQVAAEQHQVFRLG